MVELCGWSRGVTGPCAAGTSSILAGALLAAVYRCTGRTYDMDSLIHAVLHLEQVLTTGKDSGLADDRTDDATFPVSLQGGAGRTRWEVWWEASRWVVPGRRCLCG